MYTCLYGEGRDIVGFVLCFDSYYTLQIALKLQLGVERHIPKFYTVRGKNYRYGFISHF